MKKMIKSALALVAAVVLGSSAWAAGLDESCDVTMTVGVTSNMLAKLNVADAATANWVLHTSDSTVATVEWAKDGDKNVVAITSMANGQAEVVARSPEDVEYTFNVYVSTVEMEKSIKADDGEDGKSNATIRVVTHVDCGATSKTPQILFIGSLCRNHGLDSGELKDAFDALLEKGDVEYVFFDNPKGNADVVTIKNGNSNTIKKGTTTYTLPSLSDSTHSNLRAYLTYITNKLDIASANYKQYDYVVLEFDNNRLATNYNLDNNDWKALENRAARCLKKFYEKNLVLWVVDDGKGTSGENAPFYEDKKWYTPSTYRKDTDGGEMDVTCVNNFAWNGLAALLDPKMYFEKGYGERYITTADEGGTEYKTLNRIDSQVTYGEKGAIAEAINKYVKFPSFAAEAADKVVTAGGTMSIPTETGSVTLWNWTGKDDPVADDYMADDTGWVKETDAKKQPKVDGDQVTCVVSNLNGSVWQKLEIKVRTTPEFMAAAIADAKGEQKFCTPNGDGTFNVNPNNGEATMELSRSLDGKKQGTLATGAAAAANAWIVELPEFEFTVSGFERPYDGTSTNVTVSVTDKDSGKPIDASYYKLAYSTDGGTTWTTTDKVADFYAAFKDVVDTTVAVKVVITGDDTYKPSDEPKSATLTITPLDITVTAQNAEKTYGSSDPTSFAVDFDVSAAIAINEGTTVSNDLKNSNAKIERAAGENVGTYAITNNLSKPYSAGGNYTVTFVPGTFTINPAPLTVVPNAGQHVCEGDEVNVKFTATGFKYTDSQTKNYVGGSYSLESQALGKQAIVDKGGWDFGKNYTVVSSDTQGRTFEIKECSCVEIKCAYVYRVKLAGKTVKGRSLAGKTSCDVATCWKKPASLRIAGYFYGEGDTEAGACGEICGCKDGKDYVENMVFWDADKREVVFGKVEFDLFEILRNGGVQNKAQIGIMMDDLYLAGFGAFNPVSKNLKNASGFFAGKLPVVGCMTAGTCGDVTTDDKVLYFEPCNLAAAVENPSADAVAYGRWSLTYKADKARQAEEDDTWDCLYSTGW